MKQILAWVNVKDKLPDNEKKEYLCAVKGFAYSYIKICSFSKNLESVDEYDFDGDNHAGWYNYDSEYGYYECSGVTHWMELPDLPGEE
jgi:hypothetical protein